MAISQHLSRVGPMSTLGPDHASLSILLQKKPTVMATTPKLTGRKAALSPELRPSAICTVVSISHAKIHKTSAFNQPTTAVPSGIKRAWFSSVSLTG